MDALFATVIAPLIVVVLAIPLIAGWIGRNYLYGFRSPRTVASDAIWYPVNRVAGVLMLVASLIWLATGPVVGLVTLGAAALGSAVYMSWIVARQSPN
jgi:hypothetical protein